jgi:hypothetical protein
MRFQYPFHFATVVTLLTVLTYSSLLWSFYGLLFTGSLNDPILTTQVIMSAQWEITYKFYSGLEITWDK